MYDLCFDYRNITESSLKNLADLELIQPRKAFDLSGIQILNIAGGIW